MCERKDAICFGIVFVSIAKIFTMKEKILQSLHEPAVLERLYQENKANFRRVFDELYPEIKDSPAAAFWNERFRFEKKSELHWGSSREIIFVIVVSLLAGFIAKLPRIFPIDEDIFYPRNFGYIVFPFLLIYFGVKNKLSTARAAWVASVMLLALIFINLLPEDTTSSTLVLTCLHLIIFIWGILGYVFTSKPGDLRRHRMEFVRYNGDLIVMGLLIITVGGFLSAITIGLFSLLGYRIEEFYFNNIGVFGLAAAPIVSTYLVRNNPQLVGKVSAVVARIFIPLVIVLLSVYLFFLFYSGKSPYDERDFLIIFNALLLVVMALIYFAVAENFATLGRTNVWLLLILSVLTIGVSAIILSAIGYRSWPHGVTPNRLAVLGTCGIIFVNLLQLVFRLIKILTSRKSTDSVSVLMAAYLPVYVLWAGIVSFVFPLVFDFR